jgi:hypothetical protein
MEKSCALWISSFPLAKSLSAAPAKAQTAIDRRSRHVYGAGGLRGLELALPSIAWQRFATN